MEGPTIRLGHTETADSYLERLRPRFLECGYHWDTDVASEYLAVRGVAELRRTRLVAFNMSQIVFVFVAFELLSLPLLDECVAGCQRYAQADRPTPAGQGCCIIPVALADWLTPSAQTALLERHPLVPMVGRSVVPVAYELGTGTLHYSERRRTLHMVVWRPLYQIVRAMLTP